MNVCISEDFEGGELQFWEQRPGWVLFHRGSAWHRALPVTKGHRTNIIMWFRSDQYAATFGCTMCGKLVPS
eukprot:m.152898 g.152898  ORF g.152898 m.152898 type:complete len:71 (+) comp16222_c0_seq13:1155-1367(+)